MLFPKCHRILLTFGQRLDIFYQCHVNLLKIKFVYFLLSGSKFFENEKKKDEQVNQRIVEQQKKIATITEYELAAAEKQVKLLVIFFLFFYCSLVMLQQTSSQYDQEALLKKILFGQILRWFSTFSCLGFIIYKTIISSLY